MKKPLTYIAISPQLVDELGLKQRCQVLQDLAEVEFWPGNGQPTLESVITAANRAEILVSGWGTPSLKAILKDWSPERSPLRMVAHTAGSLKHLVEPEILQRGLLVASANDALAEAVAEFTFGCIFAMRRQMFRSAEDFKIRHTRASYTGMHELKGSVVGIIGAGAIGRMMMDLLRPWGVTILLYDPYTTPEKAAGYNARLVSLQDLMAQSDIVSLHAPITPETIGMLGRAQFAAMKDGALFINTARGVLVDHPALLAELQTGRISALLDVTDPTEPLPGDSPFFQLDNCVVLPHIAGHSVECRSRMGDYTIADILNYLQGRPLLRGVDYRRWNTIA